MLRPITTTIIVCLLSWAIAQNTDASDPVVLSERGVATEVAPGVTVIIQPETSADLQIAEEIFVYPTTIAAAIPFDRDVVTFDIEFISRVPTRVRLELSNPGSLVTRNELLVVPPGVRLTATFMAFQEHNGEIRVYNEEDALLAVIPYSITGGSRFAHGVSASVSTGMTSDFVTTEFSPLVVQASYRVTERETGIQAAFSVSYDGVFNASGAISGSYNW